MTIEEKAKAYDELLIKAKQIYNKENDVLIMHAIEDLFPELKEPEDEMIRKELIEHCRNTRCVTEEGAERMTKYIAWLENIPYTIDHEKREGFHLGYKAGLEKQGETVWSEETDDDAWMNDIISKLENNLQLNKAEMDWLKSLKERVQPKQKLNEHDNYVINKVLDWATFVNPTSSIFEKLPKKQFIESLKSLKQRCTWKPSDEQLGELKKVVDTTNLDLDSNILWNLYQDLKKLKGE